MLGHGSSPASNRTRKEVHFFTVWHQSAFQQRSVESSSDWMAAAHRYMETNDQIGKIAIALSN
jgi:hypothetical protein